MRSRRSGSTALPALFAAALAAAVSNGVSAQTFNLETRPYDERLLRLSEVLGAIHFLRELCGGNDGMIWRDRMTELMSAEGSTPQRRARLTRAFNTGYRSYSRTYSTCTPSAQTAINRFLAEGTEIADALAKSAP